MIPAGACSGAPAAATATSASGERQDNASKAGEAGFSGLLSGSGETPVVASGPAPASRSNTRSDAPADRHESEDSQEPREPDELPGHLLSLLDGTWPPPAVPAPRLSGSLPPASLPMPGAGRVPPPTIAGTHATAPGLPTGSAVIGAEGTLPSMRSAPDAAVAAAATATATASTGPGAIQGATLAAPTAADFAKAIGLMNAGAGGADATRESPPESGERNPLQSITSGTTPAPARVAVAPVASSTPALALPADPGAGFDDAFGARIGWLADQRIGRAEIRITPEHLGAIDVRLQIDGNRISAEFNSTHADVRHTLEASVGRLRDLLGQQGLQLAHAGVGHGDLGGERSGNRDGSAARGGDDAGTDADAIDLSTATMVRARGLLDEYA